MTEILTVPEIEQQFPSEWVLIDQPQTDKNNELQSGKVVFHSKDRDEVYRRAIAMPAPKRLAIHFTGTLPPNTVVIL
jgi:hypothetical protein